MLHTATAITRVKHIHARHHYHIHNYLHIVVYGVLARAAHIEAKMKSYAACAGMEFLLLSKKAKQSKGEQ